MTPKGDTIEETVPADAPARDRSPRSRLGLTVLAVAVLALAFGIYSGIRGRINAETTLARDTDVAAIPTVDVIHPGGNPPNQEIVLPGNVQAYADTPIYAHATGYLRHWYFDIGAHVKKGDLLAEISTPEVDDQLGQAQADLATAQANLALAQATWQREQMLFNEKWISGQDRDNAFGAYNADKTIVTSKQAQVSQLERLQSYEKIYAPFDGVITARSTDLGTLIDAGAGHELFHLSAVDKVRIFTAVPEAYTRLVHIGDAASVTLDEYPGVTFHGTLVRSTDAIDPTSRTLTIEVDVDNQDGRLLPGAYAFVHLKLEGNERAPSVTVPANAVIFRQDGLRVAVVRQGKAELVPIAIGRDYGNEVEVVSGLQASDEVIVNPADSLTSGTDVRTQSGAAAGAGAAQ